MTVGEAPASEVLTPTLRTTARRARFWAIVVAAVLLVSAVVLVAQRAGSGSAGELDPESATPEGALAVAEVLRDQGVDVVLSSSLAATRAAVAGAPSATVLLHDREGLLEAEQRAELLSLDARLVVVAPGIDELAELAPGVGAAGRALPAGTPVAAGCAIPAATRAGEIQADGLAYRILDAGAGATGCFPADDAFALVELPRGERGTAVLGPTAVLRNDAVAASGNAALALGLLGEDPVLVWYVPGLDDLRGEEPPPTLLELTADWATPLSILAVLLVVAAGVWRGRRMGPVVVERLPVVVLANETTEGRARLYERAGARLHALDALRMAALGRLASRLGLPRRATVEEIVARLAAATGRDRDELDRLLVTADPQDDRELLRLSDELKLLEAELADRTRPPRE